LCTFGGAAQTKSMPEASVMKFKRLLRKITNYGQIGRYSMTSLRACPIKIIFITIFHGLRLKNIFLRALTGPSGTLFPVCLVRFVHLFAAIL
jgi:hypothetical protein